MRVKVNGVDVFDRSTGEVRSDSPDGIACWFIDTDYDEESLFVRHAYFLGANDPYGALKITLQMFYRVNGDSTQNRGVVSDVILPSVTDREEFSESKLDYALEFDRSPATKFGTMNAVTPELVEKVRASSLDARM